MVTPQSTAHMFPVICLASHPQSGPFPLPHISCFPELDLRAPFKSPPSCPLLRAHTEVPLSPGHAGAQLLHRAPHSPTQASALLSSLPASSSSLLCSLLPPGPPLSCIFNPSLDSGPPPSAFKHAPALTSLKKAFPLIPLLRFCCQTFTLTF